MLNIDDLQFRIILQMEQRWHVVDSFTQAAADAGRPVPTRETVLDGSDASIKSYLQQYVVDNESFEGSFEYGICASLQIPYLCLRLSHAPLLHQRLTHK